MVNKIIPFLFALSSSLTPLNASQSVSSVGCPFIVGAYTSEIAISKPMDIYDRAISVYDTSDTWNNIFQFNADGDFNLHLYIDSDNSKFLRLWDNDHCIDLVDNGVKMVDDFFTYSFSKILPINNEVASDFAFMNGVNFGNVDKAFINATMYGSPFKKGLTYSGFNLPIKSGQTVWYKAPNGYIGSQYYYTDEFIYNCLLTFFGTPAVSDNLNQTLKLVGFSNGDYIGIHIFRDSITSNNEPVYFYAFSFEYYSIQKKLTYTVCSYRENDFSTSVPQVQFNGNTYFEFPTLVTCDYVYEPMGVVLRTGGDTYEDGIDTFYSIIASNGASTVSYKDGYEAGLKVGYATARSTFTTSDVVNDVWSNLWKSLDVEMLPGVNLKAVLFIPIVLAVIIIIFKVAKG